VKTTTSALACLLLAACASHSQRGSNSGETVVVLKGSPEVRIVMPERITGSDLLDGIPTIRISGPKDVQGALLLFDDQDHNGEAGPTEHVIRFPAKRVADGFVIEGVRITTEQLQSLGNDGTWSVEVIVPSTGQRHVSAQPIG
jgi:hypothetical protein